MKSFVIEITCGVLRQTMLTMAASEAAARQQEQKLHQQMALDLCDRPEIAVRRQVQRLHAACPIALVEQI